MEQENQLVKCEEKLTELKESIRFYISTPERFAEALIFAKKLEAFADEIKEKVKERGGEIMFNLDLKEIEFGNYVVKRVDPSESVDYYPRSVIDALGMDRAIAFLKIAGGKLEGYLKKASLQGAVTMDEIMKCKEKAGIKRKKGYIMLLEKKGGEEK